MKAWQKLHESETFTSENNKLRRERDKVKRASQYFVEENLKNHHWVHFMVDFLRLWIIWQLTLIYQSLHWIKLDLGRLFSHSGKCHAGNCCSERVVALWSDPYKNMQKEPTIA